MIPLSVPKLGPSAWRHLKACLDSGWVSGAGPVVSGFEGAFARYVGTPHAVAVSSGTAALQVALRIVGVEVGDEVLVPNLTFIAPASAVFYNGAIPVLVDADPDTWQINVEKMKGFLKHRCRMTRRGCVDKATGRRVRAVVPVHLLGLSSPMDDIIDLARRHGLKVVEDCAEGAGVRYKGQHVGTLGDVGTFSFNGNKIMTAGGGGMIVTSDPALAARARYLIDQAKDDPQEYVHNEIGYNYRLSSLQAALGRSQLESLESFVKRKHWIAAAYEKSLRTVEGVELMPAQKGVRATYWLYTVLTPRGTTLARRKKLIKALQAQGVGARSLWHTLHDLPPFRDCPRVDIEHSIDLYHRAISLPSSPGITAPELAHCVDTVTQSIRRL